MPQQLDTPRDLQTPPEMRGLTIRQPWAWAIVFGGKLIENRTWTTSYRGLVAIHAGGEESRRGMDSWLVMRALRAWHRRGGESKPFRRGVVIGVANLTDVHWAEPGCCDSQWAEYVVYKEDERRPGRVSHFVLENPRPIEPLPVRGRLQLWRMQPEQIEDVLRRRWFNSADQREWFERTGHCGGCGGPGDYCSCTTAAPCGCRDLHEMGSARDADALEAFTDSAPVTSEQASLFG